jgi:hypothetical protein
MPVQTTSGTIYFPDGCKVSVDMNRTGSYVDIGATLGTAKAALQWKENQVQTANFGKTQMQIKDMTIDGGFTLVNLVASAIASIGGGMFTTATTAGTAVTTIPTITIPANWSDNTKYQLTFKTSSTDATILKLPTKPVITSVQLDPTGTPETLTEIGAGTGGDYMIIQDGEAPSGWSIAFNSTGMVKGSPKTFSILITPGTNTPTARTTIYAGSSTVILNPFAIKFEHTDSNSKTRTVVIPAANPKSGGFNFNFKGADEDGIEQMDITFTGIIDTTQVDGRQLISWGIDTGAQ